LKGFLVGNGATNWEFDSTPSYTETVYGFNLIPKKHLDFMKENGCVFYLNDFKPHKGPKECEPVWDDIMKLTGDLNWYDLYRVTP